LTIYKLDCSIYDMHNIDIMKKRLAQNLDKLEAFVLVGKHGSVSRAVPEAHLSQSALSHLISKLEGSLGIELFTRKPFGLELTESGSILHEFAKRILVDVENLSARLCDSSKKPAIKIRVGTHETLSAHIWPRIIKHSAAKNGTPFVLSTGRVDGLVALLLRGDLHLIMSVEPKADSRLVTRPIYKGKLKFFCGTQWKVKNKLPARSISINSLKGVPFFTDINAHTRQGIAIPHALASVGISDLGQFELGSFEAAINLASLNLGIAVIPDRNAAAAVDKKHLEPLLIKGLKNQDSLSYQICVTYLASSPMANLFEQTILDIRQIISHGPV
jgi:DNA-binding transcriptional LysR family regulator